MPLEHIALRANAKQPRSHTEIKFSNSSERAHKWCRADSSVQLRQQLSDAALRWVAIQTSQHNIKKKKKRRADQVKENPVGCEHPTNWPGEEWKVRTSEREGKREGWRREKELKELLSHYYPSVTGLRRSCYGYGDSRLSVLLTIALEASIQRRATMQISFSAFLNLLFTSGYIFFSSCFSVLPASQTDPLRPGPRHPLDVTPTCS